MGLLQVLAFSVLGNSEETVGYGVGLMSEKETQSRLTQLARHLGEREGLGWKLRPGIKRQRPRWLLKTARADRRGPASRGTLPRPPDPAGSCGRRTRLCTFSLFKPGLSIVGSRLF